MSSEMHYADGTLTVKRTFAAPRELVFEAWVETSKVQQWWGCSQTTAVKSDVEPRVGGKYDHMMTLDGVGDYAQSARFTVYDPPKKLAYEGTEPGPDGKTVMTVTVDFFEVDGGTQVQLVHTGIPDMPVDDQGTMLPAIIQAGWTAAFGKLDALLTAQV